MAVRGTPIPSAGGSELERIRSIVATYFPVYETRVAPQSLLLAIHADRATLESKFDLLRQELARQGYLPLLRRDSGEEFIEVVRRPRLGPRRQWVNFALLAATVATTVFAGAVIWLTYVGRLDLTFSDVLLGAVYFAAPLLAILGVHETAHYVVARRRHLDASLPYFIPIPPPLPFGTFGAFVSLREPFPDRKALFDVGAAGPIAGFAMSVPIALLGLLLSTHAPAVPANYCGPSILGQSYGNLLIGPSLFWSLLSLFFPSSFMSLHPLALAGWIGILVTAINLLPAGSLDGGHIFRALLGDRARYVSYGAAFMLFGLGFIYYGWLVFAILVLVLGLRHPPPLNDLTPLDAKRYAVGAFVAAVLVTGFVLVPISVPPGMVDLTNVQVTGATPPSNATIAANFSAQVNNRDPVPHAFVFDVQVKNVSVTGIGGRTYLTGAALLSWERNATWVFVLPNGSSVGPVRGGSVALPSGEFVTINGSAAVPILIEFSNSDNATSLVVSLGAEELCSSQSGGVARTDITANF